MFQVIIALISVGILFALIFAGVHLAFSLALVSFIGVWLISGNIGVCLSLFSLTTFEGVRDYVFAVVPLFVLMGAFISNSGAAKDLFRLTNRILKKIPGGVGVATVFANAVFAAVTGVSIASAAVFSRISMPEMLRLNYKKHFAVGAIAGSSVLGMLIPPSVLLIVYGMLTGVSIGKLFVAGIIPGIVLAAIYSLGIIVISLVKPEWAGRVKHPVMTKNEGGSKAGTLGECGTGSLLTTDVESREPLYMTLIKTLPLLALVVLVLGGIWGGLFTPTEASAFGALGALVIGRMKGLKKREFKQSLLETAATTSSILLLVITAQMYSRMLSMSGAVSLFASTVAGLSVSPYLILTLFCLVLVALGCILDSTSILLVTTPLMFSVVTQLGFNPIWFGIVMVITVEMGLITPPFGIVVFTIKAAIGKDITVEEIFKGAFPFLIMMVIALVIIIAFPVLSTWLPSLM